jgi:hypothetical protein
MPGPGQEIRRKLPLPFCNVTLDSEECYWNPPPRNSPPSRSLPSSSPNPTWVDTNAAETQQTQNTGHLVFGTCEIAPMVGSVLFKLYRAQFFSKQPVSLTQNY